MAKFMYVKIVAVVLTLSAISFAAEPNKQPAPSPQREMSANMLKNLVTGMTNYAKTHDGRYPEAVWKTSLSDVNQSDRYWLQVNVEYLCAGQTVQLPPNMIVAYDKTLLQKAGATNILLAGGGVEHKTRTELARILENTPFIKERADAKTAMMQFTTALMVYASAHRGHFPDDANALNNAAAAMATVNKDITYIGAGQKASHHSQKPIAYHKALLEKGAGTVVLFASGYMKFAGPEEFKRWDINLQCDRKPKTPAELVAENICKAFEPKDAVLLPCIFQLDPEDMAKNDYVIDSLKKEIDAKLYSYIWTTWFGDSQLIILRPISEDKIAQAGPARRTPPDFVTKISKYGDIVSASPSAAELTENKIFKTFTPAPDDLGLFPYSTVIDPNNAGKVEAVSKDFIKGFRKSVDPNLYAYISADAWKNHLNFTIPAYRSKLKNNEFPSLGCGN